MDESHLTFSQWLLPNINLRQGEKTPEEPHPKDFISLGEAPEIELGYIEGSILIEKGLEEQYFERFPPQTVKLTLPNGEVANYTYSSVYEILTPLVASASHFTRSKFEKTSNFQYLDLPVLVATDDTFQNIRKSNPPLERVNDYVTGGQTYVMKGNHYYDLFRRNNPQKIQEFYDILIHELNHVHTALYVFGGLFEDEKELRRLVMFSLQNYLWLFEGFADASSGYTTDLSEDEFRNKLLTIKENYPDFSYRNLREDFWKYDKSPSNKNICYNYARRWVNYLAPYVNEALAKREHRDSAEYLPHEGIAWILSKTAERYKSGNPVSAEIVLNDELGISEAVLDRLERDFQAQILEG